MKRTYGTEAEGNGRFVRIEGLCNHVQLGKCAARKWAVEIGADRHIGRAVVYDLNVVDAALDKLGV